MRRSAPRNSASILLAIGLVALCAAASPVHAQYYTRIGPKLFYPRVDNFGNHTNVPLVMRDTIQDIVHGTRFLDVAPRIMGGEPAGIGVFPWMASIGLKGANPRVGHFCGGSFITPDWVLTAAHCVRPDSPGKIEVYGGSNALDAGGTSYDVDRVVVHEKYDRATEENDIALLHLATRFNGTTVRPLSPNDPVGLSDVGHLAVATGWGLTHDGTQVSNVLRRISVQVVSNETCNGVASYGGTIGRGMVCAGFVTNSQGSCQGDSGAPLVVGDERGGYLQAGILSWGEGCLRPLRFGVYTRVATYQPWILGHIAEPSTPVAAAPASPPSPTATRSAPTADDSVGPPLPTPAVRSVMREPPAPRSRNGGQLNATLPQIGPRRLYPQTARDTSGVPLPIRDAESFIATGRRLFAVKPRIVGGEPAPAGTYPWTASLELKNQRSRNAHFCGAAFISPEWVLTAAHCVKPESAGAIEVLGGSHELDRGGMTYPVDRILVHEKYDAGTQDYDVALVHLASRYDGPTIRPITADEARELAAPGRPAVVAGWGLTAEGTDVSDILRRVNVEIQSPAACNAEAAYGGTVNGELMLCAGFATGGKDACQGDSGGPLMVMDRAGGYLQAGIVSWGEGCARPNRYGVYTRVSAVEPWIAEHTGGRRGPVAATPASRSLRPTMPEFVGPPLPRSVPMQTRTRAIEESVAPPPRSGVRSNSRVELPGNVRAQAKKAKYPRRAAAKPHALKHRAADSRAESEPIAPAYDSRLLRPTVVP